MWGGGNERCAPDITFFISAIRTCEDVRTGSEVWVAKAVSQAPRTKPFTPVAQPKTSTSGSERDCHPPHTHDHNTAYRACGGLLPLDAVVDISWPALPSTLDLLPPPLPPHPKPKRKSNSCTSFACCVCFFPACFFCVCIVFSSFFACGGCLSFACFDAYSIALLPLTD